MTLNQIIRFRMLIDNKLSKYFLFAIGEILLVAIGILIAISVDNWNEERKAISRDITLYEKITMDLKVEYGAVEDIIERLKNHQDVHYHIYYETQGNAEYDSNQDYSRLRWTYYYDPIVTNNHSDAAAYLANEGIRVLLNEYIKIETRSAQATEYWNALKINDIRPYLSRYGVFDSNEIFNDTPYEHLSLLKAKVVNYDKLKIQFGTVELDQLLFELRIKTAYSIRLFEELLEGNTHLRLALENEIELFKKK
jgi:hypothetical protein